MNLNELFTKNDIDPSKVLVLRHRLRQSKFDKALPLLAAESPDLFNAYQQTQSEQLEKVMTGGGYVASFIGHEPRRALYIGLYEIGGYTSLTKAEFWLVPEHIKMKPFGFIGTSWPSVLRFDLTLMDFYSSWKGKLVVDWPPPERSWWRRAHRNEIPVRAIAEDSLLDPPMARWEDVVFSWSELSILPKRSQAKLSEWRGVYYIFDKLKKKGYVGAAYGADNILGRWRDYAGSGHGGNKLLRLCDPHNFSFSILQRVSPDMDVDDIVRLESTWKKRLHSREPDGLNDN